MIHTLTETNWLTADNARKLAQRIETYWAIRGETVHTTVERESTAGNGPAIYVIRSDMLNGLPRRG